MSSYSFQLTFRHKPAYTNRHAYTFLLVVFKPAEISCNSVKSLPVFTLACKKNYLSSACPCWLLRIKAYHFSNFQLHHPFFLLQFAVVHFSYTSFLHSISYQYIHPALTHTHVWLCACMCCKGGRRVDSQSIAGLVLFSYRKKKMKQ